MAFVGPGDPEAPEAAANAPPPALATGRPGQWPPPRAVLQQHAAAAQELPKTHVAYRVHVHLQKNKVSGSLSGMVSLWERLEGAQAALLSCWVALWRGCSYRSSLSLDGPHTCHLPHPPPCAEWPPHPHPVLLVLLARALHAADHRHAGEHPLTSPGPAHAHARLAHCSPPIRKLSTLPTPSRSFTNTRGPSTRAPPRPCYARPRCRTIAPPRFPSSIRSAPSCSPRARCPRWTPLPMSWGCPSPCGWRTRMSSRRSRCGWASCPAGPAATPSTRATRTETARLTSEEGEEGRCCRCCWGSPACVVGGCGARG